jgi:hypothetical protein
LVTDTSRIAMNWPTSRTVRMAPERIGPDGAARVTEAAVIVMRTTMCRSRPGRAEPAHPGTATTRIARCRWGKLYL